MKDVSSIIAAERRDVYSYAMPIIISAKSEMPSVSLFTGRSETTVHVL
jgi:hypothetical protein